MYVGIRTFASEDELEFLANLQGAIMRMLTRMHLEREFKLNNPAPGKQSQNLGPAASGQSMAHFPMEADLQRHALHPIQP